MSLEEFKQVMPKDFSKEAELIDKTIKDLNIAKNAKILDVGTGFGAMAILLALNGFNVLTGQPKSDANWSHHHNHNSSHEHDCSHHFENVKSWSENALFLGVRDRIEFEYFDVEKLKFGSESFDAVFMYDSLQHVSDRGLALNQCLRVLKPEGLVCVIEWNKQTVDCWNTKEDLGMEYVDPREILGEEKVSFELVFGKEINIYIIRKNLNN